MTRIAQLNVYQDKSGEQIFVANQLNGVCTYFRAGLIGASPIHPVALDSFRLMATYTLTTGAQQLTGNIYWIKRQLEQGVEQPKPNLSIQETKLSEREKVARLISQSCF